MRRCGRAVVLVVLASLLVSAVTGIALGLPAPPPPDPGGDARRDPDTLAQRADAAGRLTAELAELDERTDDLHAALAAERETAQDALVELQSAQSAARAAAARAAAADAEVEAAGVAVDAARGRFDAFVVATYQHGLDLGPLGLLSEATGPADLLARAAFDDAVARSALRAQDGLERARVARANAASTARAALQDARDREAAAEAAKAAADGAVERAQAAAREHAARLAAVEAQRAEVNSRLDAADAGRRARFAEWQQGMAAEQVARDRAEQQAAAARLAEAGPAVGGSAAVQRVIDRALSQIGVRYVWGGGNGNGPSTGIPDAAGSPLDRMGFDCSGLMLYAFNGAGVALPRVSRNQFDAGRKVPVSDLRPGDMVFYARPDAPIHHVALYLGDGRMIEAPYTGAEVRVTALRTRDLLPQATRVL